MINHNHKYKYRFSRTQIIQLVSLALMAGLVISKYVGANYFHFLYIGAMLCIVSLKRPLLLLLGICFVFFGIGMLRGTYALSSFSLLQARYDQNVTIQGVVIDDPIYTKRSQKEFHLNNIALIENQEKIRTGGEVRVRGFSGTSKVSRGDIVEVRGKLRPGYGSWQASLYFAQIDLKGKRTTLIENMRNRFIATVNTLVPGAEGALGLGFLVGTRSLLPDSLENQLSITGLTHIVAVSGYNLTIIIRIIRRFFARHSRFLATIGSVGLIVGFLAITGISPSVARASVVSGLALIAWYYGRAVKPMVLLLLSGAITASINPTYIWFDIGWYLSFLAFFGVLVLSPLIIARIFKDKHVSQLSQIFVETMSAQIMTMPLIALIFQEVSVVSLLSNLIILPIVPIAMALTFISGIFGMISIQIGLWTAIPANIILNFMTNSIARFASFPWASHLVNISWIWLVVIYTNILLVLATIRKKAKNFIDSTRSVIE